MKKCTLILLRMTLLSFMIMTFPGCDKSTDEPGIPMLHENLTLSEPTLWQAANSPHTIRGQLIIHNTVLTIEPGTIIRMEPGARIVVRGDMGAIIAEGTPDKGIIFTSAAANPVPGDWEHIDINGTSVVSSFSYCLIEYGGKNTSRGMLNISNGRVRVHHSILAHSFNAEVKIDNDRGFEGFSNNTLISVNGDAIFMRGRLAHSLEGGNAFTVPQGGGIRLSGMAANRIDITQSMSLQAQPAPYIVEDPIRIQDNAVLTIEAGAVLRFLSDKELIVGYMSPGGLVAVGTEAQKVVFTSANAMPQKGDWGSIRFTEHAMPGSLMEYCVISFAGSSVSFKGNITVDPCGAGNPVIRHCEIHDSKHFGVYRKKRLSAWGEPLMHDNHIHNNTSGDVGQDS